MSPEVKKDLTERGKLFREIATGIHYYGYTGNLIRKSWFGATLFKAYVGDLSRKNRRDLTFLIG